MAKVPIRIIWLNRAEGPTKDVGERTVTSLEAADAILRRWARTAPEGGGYHKVDFTITWNDGQEYSGRYDLQYEDTTKKNLLGDEVQRMLAFHAGYWCPPHMTREQCRTYLDQMGYEEGGEKQLMAKNFLENYEL